MTENLYKLFWTDLLSTVVDTPKVSTDTKLVKILYITLYFIRKVKIALFIPKFEVTDNLSNVHLKGLGSLYFYVDEVTITFSDKFKHYFLTFQFLKFIFRCLCFVVNFGK